MIIGPHTIGAGCPPYIIAELSANHNGDIQRAFSIMEAAKRSGAHAIKLQTYTADTMTIDHDGPEFCIQSGLWDGRKLHDLYREAGTPWEWHKQLFDKAAQLGLTVFSTPFDHTAVDFLEDLNCPAYKIASFEATDLPLISKVASTGKPMIISTGLANLDEIGEAVETARSGGCRDLALLHCTSGYPAPVEDANLNTIADLSKRFGVISGLSDHTHGTVVSVCGVALGAAIIEKHFTLARADGGPDSAFSLEPHELTALVADCHAAWQALGAVNYDLKPSERANLVFRRSVYVVKDMKAGETFSPDNVRIIRPGYGLAPKRLQDVLGRHAKIDIPYGTALQEGHIA